MSRIAALQPPYAPELQQQFDRIMRGAPPLMLFRVIAGNARAWEKFRAGSLLDRGPLSLREREIVIDRTCALTGCEYEWGVHVATFADAAQLTEEQVRATVRGRADAPCWSAAEQALIAAVDALHHRADAGAMREFDGAGGALRRGEDLRDHPALRLLSHRVVSRERAGPAAGIQGSAVSGGDQLTIPAPSPLSVAPSPPRWRRHATPARSKSWICTMPTGLRAFAGVQHKQSGSCSRS